MDAQNRRVGEYQYAGTDEPYAPVTGWADPSAIQYQERDAVGDVIGTHQGTTVTQTVRYDPWGTPTISGDGTSRLLWKGLLYEPGPEQGDVVGLYYMRGRWYDPQLGRFIQEDPIHAGVNDYVFAGDDPVNGWDPSGLHSGYRSTDCSVGTEESLLINVALDEVTSACVAFGYGGTFVTGLGGDPFGSDPFGGIDNGPAYGSPPGSGPDGGGLGAASGATGGNGTGPKATPTQPAPGPKWRSARCVSAVAGLGLAGLNTWSWFWGGGEAAFFVKGASGIARAWKVTGRVTQSIAEHGAEEATLRHLSLAGFETAFTGYAFHEEFGTKEKVQAVLELFPVLDVGSTLYTAGESCV